MKGPGHQLLAGAALPLDEDGGIRGRHVFDELIDYLHLGVFANEVAKPGGGVHPTSQGADFFFMLHGPPERPGVLADDQPHQLDFFVAARALRTGDNDGAADLTVIKRDYGLAFGGRKVFRDQRGFKQVLPGERHLGHAFQGLPGDLEGSPIFNLPSALGETRPKGNPSRH